MMSAKSYATLMLRALGYNDKNGDFNWSTALETAKEKEILSENEYNLLKDKQFLRDDMVSLSYNTLTVKIKDNNDKSLIDKLIEEEVVQKDIGVALHLVKEIADSTIEASKVEKDIIEEQPKTNLDKIREHNELVDNEITVTITEGSVHPKYGQVMTRKIKVDMSKLPNAYAIFSTEQDSINKLSWDNITEKEIHWVLNNGVLESNISPPNGKIVYVVFDSEYNIMGYSIQ
ncbi:hypothetical protein [Vallitalea sp.]|jgi:hypothetical protein|uniref:hypothetical protein n=1 Tax=Vallitalea sp. TaxID=1882829 RepID=UPI0025DC856B|nr:hypothetical protein [Vallitalea sp.]MCT4686585.1 hypothetical protein [Vallitalea sp.]